MIRLILSYLRARRQSAPAPEFRARLKHRLQAVAQEQGIAQADHLPWYRGLARTFAVPSTAALVIIFSIGSYAYASPAVSEGTPLYPVKTSLETIEGIVHFTPEGTAQFQIRIARRRAQEASYNITNSPATDSPEAPQAIPPVRVMIHAVDRATETLRESRDIDAQTRAHMREDMSNVISAMQADVTASHLPDDRKAEIINHLKIVNLRMRLMQRLEDGPATQQFEARFQEESND